MKRKAASGMGTKGVLKAAVIFMLVLSVLWGCSGKENPQETAQSTGSPNVSPQATADPAEPPTELKLVFEENSSVPYNKDWVVWKYINEAVNIKLDTSPVAGTAAETYPQIIAGGNLPDLFHIPGMSFANQYGDQGVFLNLLDYLDQMPNYAKWLKDHPLLAKQFTSPDGKMYMSGSQGINETDRTTWIYRQDIFEKHGLKIPANFDELYEVLKELKTLYPDSYPLALRFGEYFGYSSGAFTNNFEVGPSFYLDVRANEVKYGPEQAGYRKSLEYMSKFYKEGLLAPDFLTYDTAKWQSQITNNQGFVTYDYLVRVEFFNDAMANENKEFKMNAMLPPPAGDTGGKGYLIPISAGGSGFGIASTSKNVDAALRFIDWTFSEEGREAVSWGKEGETYEIVDGKKQFLPEYKDLFDLGVKTGLGAPGTYTWYDASAMLSFSSPEIVALFEEAKQYDPTDIIQLPAIPKTKEDQETLSVKGAALETYRSENVAKFMTGVQSFDKWDSYVNGLHERGLDEVLELYNEAMK